MKRDSLAYIAAGAYSLLLACLFILTLAMLVNERSKDIVRLTVPPEQLLPTVGKLQLATHKTARAYPIRDRSNRVAAYRIVIDGQSQAF